MNPDLYTQTCGWQTPHGQHIYGWNDPWQCPGWTQENTDTLKQLGEFIDNIEDGTIKLTKTGKTWTTSEDPPYVGEYQCQAPDGRTITIFYDSGDWDYIDNIDVFLPDGTIQNLDFTDDLVKKYPTIAYHRPTSDETCEAYFWKPYEEAKKIWEGIAQ